MGSFRIKKGQNEREPLDHSWRRHHNLCRRFYFSALPALRHSGLEQRLCRRRSRWPAVKKIPQHGHLRFLVRFAVDRQPRGGNGSIPEEKEAMKKKGRGRRLYAEFFGRKYRGWMVRVHQRPMERLHRSNVVR